jgi:predicted ATPase/class 3 adenylate cyclase
MADPSRALPTGTVTFLFTDIEGSTPLWEKHPEAMKAALAKHDAILHAAIESNHGHVLQSAGDGLHAVFATAAHGLQATLDAQRALCAYAWDEIKPSLIRVRMGIHTGEADLREGDYYGGTLNRAARIMAAGHGGQVLISGITAGLLRGQLPEQTTLVDLGEHRLKGLLQAEHIFQVSAPDLAKDFPALKTLRVATNNLPAQLSSFIGRDQELKEAQDELASTRLLTLVGPGGTGKTRLSIQIASEQLDRFKDGAWLVELAPITDPAFIVSSIANVFELREARGVPLISVLIDYLREKEALLVLDNCEHLVEGTASVADQLLRSCPKLKIIASTREALSVDGETIHRVPSLSLPAGPADEVMNYEATRLFVERAAKAEPRFQVTKTNAAAIVQICQRLDGIPLAIELAAARVKLFTPKQIAERLDDRFQLLSGGSRSALPRQQTLRALIDWSYQTLTGVEQLALRRLAVFSGGWTIEGAEAVIGEGQAIEGLLGLVNKSLVNVTERLGASRYDFLQTIRQYAMEKLVEADEAAETRDRHLHHILTIAGSIDPNAGEAERLAWFDQMETEHDNLRAALGWSSAHNAAEGVQLGVALGDFWLFRDYNTEAEAWCQNILAHSDGLQALANARASLNAVLAQAAIFMGDHDLARKAAATGIVLAEQAGDKDALMRLYSLRGLAGMYFGDFAGAAAALQHGEALARETGSARDLALMLVFLAQLNYFSGGDIEQTKAYVAEADTLTLMGDMNWSRTMLGFAFARLSAAVQHFERARTLFEQTAESAERWGNLRLVCSCHSELAHMLRRQGKLDEAVELYAEALPVWRDLGHRSAVAHELECIAFILSARTQSEQALTVLGAAEVLRASVNAAMTKPEQAEYDQVLAGLRKGVDATRWKESWAAGRAMDMDQAVDFALEAARGRQ